MLLFLDAFVAADSHFPDMMNVRRDEPCFIRDKMSIQKVDITLARKDVNML